MSGSCDCYGGQRRKQDAYSVQGGGRSLTCWEHGLPPGGKATGKCRARWGGTSFFFFRTVFSQCAVTHLFLSFIACKHNSARRSLGALLQAPTQLRGGEPARSPLLKSHEHRNFRSRALD